MAYPEVDVVSGCIIGHEAYEDVSLNEEEDASSTSSTGEEQSPPFKVGKPFSANKDFMKQLSEGDDEDESIVTALDLMVGDEGDCILAVCCCWGSIWEICVTSPHQQLSVYYFTNLVLRIKKDRYKCVNIEVSIGTLARVALWTIALSPLIAPHCSVLGSSSPLLHCYQ